MNLKRLLIASLCLGYALQSSAQEIDINGKLFIIGGGSRPASMVDRMVKESGIDKGGYGIVLPMSSSEPDSSAYYATNQFYKLGVNNVYGLNFIKDEVLTVSKLDSIRNAKLIYISGGDQNKFMDIVQGTEIEVLIHEAYENGSLIAGTSAGAAVMSEMMITGTELKHPKYNATYRHLESENIETKTGLGLITTIIVDQHFVYRSRYNRLLTAIIEYPELTGVGIDESTAILVSGKTVEVVGESQVVVFKNPDTSKTTFNDKIGAHGIILNIYLPGETFKID
ncbi:cyanophycinase [Winogradskyella thalassocola]|uniref:Cyanophycinase n=1 Tax=Winogradskyella thalassocola TaxID=262004 RepID=A0A1G8LLR0_9FLAO|nr:cyanophycinase [Winogradskyella thalassocola]SDI56618.1 cyanophycinase [Winogradskyella thalassocola]